MGGDSQDTIKDTLRALSGTYLIQNPALADPTQAMTSLKLNCHTDGSTSVAYINDGNEIPPHGMYYYFNNPATQTAGCLQVEYSWRGLPKEIATMMFLPLPAPTPEAVPTRWLCSGPASVILLKVKGDTPPLQPPLAPAPGTIKRQRQS